MSVLASYNSLTLHLHPGAYPALETEWLGFASSTDFRRYIGQALQLAEQHGVRAWIANDRLLGAVRPVDLEWVSSHVLPEMEKLGIVRFARLESEATMNRLLIGNMYQETVPDLPFEMRAFATIGEARAWATGL